MTDKTGIEWNAILTNEIAAAIVGGRLPLPATVAKWREALLSAGGTEDMGDLDAHNILVQHATPAFAAGKPGTTEIARLYCLWQVAQVATVMPPRAVEILSSVMDDLPAFLEKPDSYRFYAEDSANYWRAQMDAVPSSHPERRSRMVAYVGAKALACALGGFSRLLDIDEADKAAALAAYWAAYAASDADADAADAAYRDFVAMSDEVKAKIRAKILGLMAGFPGDP